MPHSPSTPDAAQSAPRATPSLPDTALVPVRPRHDGWTPARQRQFIETLADTACVEAAARAAGMTPQSAWRLRRRGDAGAFDAAWDAALERGFQRLVTIALDRAVNGSIRQRWYHGELVGEERVHHDGLLLALMKRGERMLDHDRVRRALREDWDGGMAALEAGARDADDLAGGRYGVWIEAGAWFTNCPPGADFREGIEVGSFGTPDYRRTLSTDEARAHAARRGTKAEGEAAWRALFAHPGAQRSSPRRDRVRR